ncbi:hypothetical protein PtB15_1B449 [Puccinia triticina]|nr:hypothetical protein PtB15_1B449 [Puccinia triticina]
MNPSSPQSISHSTVAPDSPTHSAGLYNFEDGYDYISEPNENLVCPICRNPFIEPVMCESTDHIFCQSCLIKSLEVSATCPIDRLPLSLSLIVPAPKIINKLVDELLVSCPLKSKLGCSFVCQRDLVLNHVHTHQAQLDHVVINPSLNPQQPQAAAPLLDSNIFQRSVLDHVNSKSGLLRFQWLNNRATLVSKAQDPTQVRSATDLTRNESKLSRCPWERFGCSFMGTPEEIAQQHLSVASDVPVTSDVARCRFASIQEIMYWFEHLEARNVELKGQLSQSLVQQGQLTSVLDKLKVSFRQLWSSQKTTSEGAASPLVTASGPSRPGDLHRASILSRLEIPDGYPSEAPSPEHSTEVSPTHHLSDDPPSTSGSRMAYGVNGARLRRCDDHPVSAMCAGRCAQFYSPIGSPAQVKVRVKTFLRRGEILTPTTEEIPHEFPDASAEAPLPSKITATPAGLASLSSSHSSLKSGSPPVSETHTDPSDLPKRISWW